MCTLIPLCAVKLPVLVHHKGSLTMLVISTNVMFYIIFSLTAAILPLVHTVLTFLMVNTLGLFILQLIQLIMGAYHDKSIKLHHLNRSDGSLSGSGDSFLHGAHVSGQGGLVTHSRWNTT